MQKVFDNIQGEHGDLDPDQKFLFFGSGFLKEGCIMIRFLKLGSAWIQVMFWMPCPKKWWSCFEMLKNTNMKNIRTWRLPGMATQVGIARTWNTREEEA